MTTPAALPLTYIKTRADRKHQIATSLLSAHQTFTPVSRVSRVSHYGVRVVCISDTHNTRPILPDSDILIHAGDLTENGSFEEMQRELSWLSSQLHQHKIFVAGNHDVLFDDDFLAKYPERKYGDKRTRKDLDWGSVIYLQDTSTTLKFHPKSQEPTSLTIFGSPWTPRYGISAFQYHPNTETHWRNIFACLDKPPDILITHTPPHLHLDKRDFHRAGCPFLAEEIHRLRPKLHVFGHIHASYGKKLVRLDGVQRIYEEVMTGWAGWLSILYMGLLVLWSKIRLFIFLPSNAPSIIFVNASIVGASQNTPQHEPVVVDL